MKEIYVTTANSNRCTEICHELADPAAALGPTLAVFSGDAGRGKTEFAKQHASRTDAVYVPPLKCRTPTMLLRDICFELIAERPYTSQACIDEIERATQQRRRLVFVDEADLLPASQVEMLRNLNDRYAWPVVFIVEKGGLRARSKRVNSRVRATHEFSELAQADLYQLYSKALGVDLAADVLQVLLDGCGGDWRPAKLHAQDAEQAMRASGVDAVTLEMAEAIVNNGHR